MAWTDEIVEQLKQHWIDGKSASQIAGLLGNGVTRNAVIGKVHRLGLAGRAKTPSTSVPRPRRLAPPPVHRVAGPRLSSPAPRMMRGATAFALAPQTLSELESPRGIRERRPADVAPGDDRRTERIDVPLAAGRPGDFRIPLLRLARGVRPLLHLPWRPRLPAGPGPAPRSRSVSTGSPALS